MSLLVWWCLFSAITALLFAALMFPVLSVVKAFGHLDGRLGPVFALVGLVSLAAGAFATRRIESRFVNPSESIAGQPGRSARIQEAADYERVEADGPAMLVIRGVDDEAALSLAAGSIGSLLFLFLAALCKATFGREFMGAAFLCEIAADSTPDASARIDSITLSPVVAAGARFRHSIYDHPDCAKHIAGWIGQVVGRYRAGGAPTIGGFG